MEIINTYYSLFFNKDDGATPRGCTTDALMPPNTGEGGGGCTGRCPVNCQSFNPCYCSLLD